MLNFVYLVFYDSLLVEKPDSHMAQEWCVAHGTLPQEEAYRLYKIICKRKNIQMKLTVSPSKQPKTNTKSKANGKSRNNDKDERIKKKAKTSSSDGSVRVADTGNYWCNL